MGLGPIVNGKQKPITPYKGSWAETMKPKEKVHVPDLLQRRVQRGS